MARQTGVFFRGESAKTAAGWHAQIHRAGKWLHSPRHASENAARLWVKTQGQWHPTAVVVPKEQLAVPPTKEPAGKRRLSAKTYPASAVASPVKPEQEQSVTTVTMATRLAELEGAVERGKVKLAAMAARCRELEDQNDWYHCSARAQMEPPQTLLRRTRSRGK